MAVLPGGMPGSGIVIKYGTGQTIVAEGNGQ